MKLMTQAPTPGLKLMQEIGLKAAWAKITGVWHPQNWCFPNTRVTKWALLSTLSLERVFHVFLGRGHWHVLAYIAIISSSYQKISDWKYWSDYVRTEFQCVDSTLQWEGSSQNIGWQELFHLSKYFHRTQVNLGSNLWVQMFVSNIPCWDLTDVTLADEDTNSILTDNANGAVQVF